MSIFGWGNDLGCDLIDQTLLQQQRQRNQQMIDGTADLQRHSAMRETRNAAGERKKRIYTEIELRKVKERLEIIEAERNAYRNIAIFIGLHRRGYKDMLEVLSEQGKLPYAIEEAHAMALASVDRLEDEAQEVQKIVAMVDRHCDQKYEPKKPFPPKA